MGCEDRKKLSADPWIEMASRQWQPCRLTGDALPIPQVPATVATFGSACWDENQLIGGFDLYRMNTKPWACPYPYKMDHYEVRGTLIEDGLELEVCYDKPIRLDDRHWITGLPVNHEEYPVIGE